MKKNGYIHIYTGDGKGKTTSVMGLALRASFYNNKILICQFLKSRVSGEIEQLQNYSNINIYRPNTKIKKFFWQLDDNEKEQFKHDMYTGWLYVKNEIQSNNWDMIIMDEIIPLINYNLIKEEEIIETLKNKPINLELILTGREASESIIKVAHYTSQINMIKHPFSFGIQAREGIEF